MKAIITLCVLSTLLVISSSVVLKGPCENVQTVGPSFNVPNYMGLWYEISRFKNPFEADSYCDTAAYSLESNGSVLVVNSEFLGSPTGKPLQAVGQAVPADPTDPSKLLVTFSTSPFPAPYWIVDTDYVTYAMVWTCYDVSGGHEEYAWILSRTPSLNDTTYNDIIAEWVSYGVPVQYFETGIQDGCWQ